MSVAKNENAADWQQSLRVIIRNLLAILKNHRGVWEQGLILKNLMALLRGEEVIDFGFLLGYDFWFNLALRQRGLYC